MIVWTVPYATERGILRARHGRSQDHEFNAALTDDCVAAPHAHDQTPGNRKQQLVTNYMTLEIIDVFEAIHPDQRHHQLLLLPINRSHRLA